MGKKGDLEEEERDETRKADGKVMGFADLEGVTQRDKKRKRRNHRETADVI